jgi:putative endonuclease
MKKGGCVYIMTNKRNGTLYTGVTSRLVERISEHRMEVYVDSFTAKYNCKMLVYYAPFHSIEEAIVEEKRIKGGNRKLKLKLIEELNPQWKDLWEEIKDW